MKTHISILLLVVVGCLQASGGPVSKALSELQLLLQQVSREIEKNPNDAALYLQRAELHRAHLGWDAAMADIERAAVLTNQWPQLHLARATLYFDAQWFESAVEASTRFIKCEPDNALALTTRARARVKLGQNLDAAGDFTLAIKNAVSQGPELYVERAEALRAAGAPHVDEALRGLDEGIKTLGPTVTLQLAAIDIEVRQNRIDAALARVDRVMAQAPRKEVWLNRRGDILRQAGRNQEAAAAYAAALQSLDTLPAARRAVPAMADLEARIRKALAEVNSSPR
jgi:tetratricopeptide (TPR) repeat protein